MIPSSPWMDKTPAEWPVEESLFVAPVDLFPTGIVWARSVTCRPRDSYYDAHRHMLRVVDAYRGGWRDE